MLRVWKAGMGPDEPEKFGRARRQQHLIKRG